MLVFEDAVVLLKVEGHLGDPWRDEFEQVLDDLLRLVLEKHLEVLNDHLTRTVALDADSEDVLFDLGHRRLPHQLFILLAEHPLHLVFKLRVLLQILANTHQLRWLL